MVINQPPQTLLERLNRKGSVTVVDVYQELVRIKGLRQVQGKRLVSFGGSKKPKCSVSFAARLLGNADKVFALITGVTAGMRMIHRIKRLFR